MYPEPQQSYDRGMKLLMRVSRAIARFNRWIGPTVAADSMVRGGGMGGTQVDPRGLDLLKSELGEDGAEKSKE